MKLVLMSSRPKTGVVTLNGPPANRGLRPAAGPDGALYLELQSYRASTLFHRQYSPRVQAQWLFGDGGPPIQAGIDPDALAVNPVTGDVAIGDDISVTIRLVSGGKIQTVAGAPHSAGDGGPAVLAQFNSQAEAADPAGNVYVIDTSGSRIRKISPSGIITTFAGSGIAGYSGDGGKATLAAISPGSIAADPKGNVYFANYNSTIRKVDTNGIISTVAGGGTVPLSGGVPATSVAFPSRLTIGLDGLGNLYIGVSNQIFIVDPAGTLFNFAGTGQVGSSTDGTPAKSAQIGVAVSIAADASGNVYFGDRTFGLVRMVDRNGLLQTIAGNGNASFDGSLISAGAARSTIIGTPQFLVVDASGNVYFQPQILNSRPQVVMVDPTPGI